MNETSSITVHGAHWCPDCRRSKQFLGEHQIPTIEFTDGSILVESFNAELAAKLGLVPTAKRSHYDLITIGSGLAKLTAALYAAREEIDILVIERAALGGQAAATQWLDNVPGFADGIEGGVFAEQLRRQAKRFDVGILRPNECSASTPRWAPTRIRGTRASYLGDQCLWHLCRWQRGHCGPAHPRVSQDSVRAE
ncbi:MAG: hypothetical protein GY832_06885 [Chloroflexi bacterium]|nr:hypothetical protein [Chloroflexota bacterium]